MTAAGWFQEDEKQKKALLSALCAKANAQAAMTTSTSGGGGLEVLDATMAELEGWVDPLAHDARLMVAVEKAHGRLGCALAALEKAVEADDKAVSRELWAERADLMAELGWTHWEGLARRSLAARFPDAHQPF